MIKAANSLECKAVGKKANDIRRISNINPNAKHNQVFMYFFICFFICVFVMCFSPNVLKARHFGFTPHAKGGRNSPNVENRRVGGFELGNPC